MIILILGAIWARCNLVTIIQNVVGIGIVIIIYGGVIIIVNDIAIVDGGWY